jgi:hypothetical protein
MAEDRVPLLHSIRAPLTLPSFPRIFWIKQETSRNIDRAERELIVQGIKDFEDGKTPNPYANVNRAFKCMWSPTLIGYSLPSVKALFVWTEQGQYFFWQA